MYPFACLPTDDQSVFEHPAAGSRAIDVTDYDRVIIEKDRRYLACIKDGLPVWHWSTYQAWWDPYGGKFAKEVARKLDARIRTFNPITGDIA